MFVTFGIMFPLSQSTQCVAYNYVLLIVVLLRYFVQSSQLRIEEFLTCVLDHSCLVFSFHCSGIGF